MAPGHIGFIMATTTLVLMLKRKLQDEPTSFRASALITGETGSVWDTGIDAPGQQGAL